VWGWGEGSEGGGWGGGGGGGGGGWGGGSGSIEGVRVRESARGGMCVCESVFKIVFVLRSWTLNVKEGAREGSHTEHGAGGQQQHQFPKAEEANGVVVHRSHTSSCMGNPAGHYLL